LKIFNLKFEMLRSDGTLYLRLKPFSLANIKCANRRNL
jgi:hypothetical protein